MIFGQESLKMVAHKKIILQWGAIFLLVALKIHIASSKSLTDNEHHQSGMDNFSSVSSDSSSSQAETVPTFEVSSELETPVENYSLSLANNSSLSQPETVFLQNAGLNNSLSLTSKKKEFETQQFHFNSSMSSEKTLNTEDTDGKDQYLKNQKLPINGKQSSNHSMQSAIFNSSSSVPTELLDDDVLDL